MHRTQLDDLERQEHPQDHELPGLHQEDLVEETHIHVNGSSLGWSAMVFWKCSDVNRMLKRSARASWRTRLLDMIMSHRMHA